MIQEITTPQLDTKQFTDEKVNDIRQAVGDGMVINALSGGVDPS